MAADVTSPLSTWSTTAASNAPAGTTAISTNLDDNLREIQAVVRTLAASNTIASAGTTDLSTINETFVTVSGTTTITGFGTVSAGIYKWLVFSGALTLTHNATSLILPTAANITTVAGDTALVLSLGSGNWRCLNYSRASGRPVSSAVTIDELGDALAAGTVEVGAYQQTWNWDFSGNSQTGMKMKGQSTAGNRTSTYLLHLDTESNYISPFKVTVQDDTITLLDMVRDGNVTLNSGPGGSLTLRGHDRTDPDTGTGGPVFLRGGVSYQAAGQNVSIQAGYNSDAGGTRYAGGSVTVEAKSGAGSSGSHASGGSVTLTAGEGTSAATDGNVVMKVGSQAVLSVVGAEEHVYVSGATAPTFKSGSGGTAGSKGIVGRDNAFTATMGATPGTSCTFTFGTEWGTAPVVSAITSKASVMLSVTAVSTTEVTIATSSAWADGDKLHVICVGYA